MRETIMGDQVISVWTSYNTDMLAMHLAGITHISKPAAEALAKEAELQYEGAVLRFYTRTSITGKLAENLDIAFDTETERAWTLEKKTGPLGRTSYRLALTGVTEL